MGIGAAFAAGIVSGLTRNMEMEFQKRISDQEKIDKLGLLMAEYNMKPADERSAAGVNAVSAALKTAQAEVKGRDPVNLLGTRSAPLDIDMAKLTSTLDETAAGEWYVGEGENKVWFQGKFPDSMTASVANSFFGEMQGHLANPAMVKILSTNKNAYEKLDGLVSAGIAAKNDASMQSDREKPLVFNPDLLSWYGEWQRIGGIVNASTTTDLETHAAQSLQNANPDMNVIGVFTTNEADGSITMGSISFDGFENQAELEKTFGNVGIALGASSPHAVYTAYKNGITQLVKADGTLLSEADQRSYFADSIKLGTAIPYIRRIRPGEGLYNQPPGGYGGLYNAINKYNTDGTFENGVFALYPHMIDSENGSPYKVGITMGAYQELERNEDAANFALVLHYGADNLAGKTFQTLVTERDSNRTVVKELQKFAKISAAELGYPAAYGKFKQIFRFLGDLGTAVFSDMGFVDSMGFSDAEKARIRDGDFSEDFLASLQEQVERARGRGVNEEGISYAELTSLKIGLAFKMARAADPSGRLSNQDVLQQLERLGTDFDTAEQVVAKVGVVIEEFESKYKKLDVLVKYGRGDGGRLSATKKAVIEAAVAYDHISRQAVLGTGEKAFRPTYSNFDLIKDTFTKSGGPVFLAYKDATSKVFEQKDGKPVYYTNVGTTDDPKYVQISESMLTTERSNASGDPAATGVLPMRPGDASNDPAATGVLPMRNASGDPAATGVLPMRNASGDPAATGVLPMRPGDASGDPAATGVLPMTNASGDPAATGVLPTSPVDQGAAIIDRLSDYIDALEKKQRGEDDKAQEEADRTARGPASRPRARPKTREIEEDRTNASGDPADTGVLPMTNASGDPAEESQLPTKSGDVELRPGEFSTAEYRFVSGDNVNGMKIQNRTTGEIVEGLFIVRAGNIFTPIGGKAQ